MILYHGSNVIIDNIILSKCRLYKDFGRGFYLTENNKHAIDMATRTCEIHGGEPLVTAFEFDKSQLNHNLGNTCVFREPSEEWAKFVMNNRNRRLADIKNSFCNFDNRFDIVFGPVANDNLTYLFRDFTRGNRDMESLIKGLTYKKLSTQYSFHTEKGIALLKRIGVI